MDRYHELPIDMDFSLHGSLIHPRLNPRFGTSRAEKRDYLLLLVEYYRASYGFNHRVPVLPGALYCQRAMDQKDI